MKTKRFKMDWRLNKHDVFGVVGSVHIEPERRRTIMAYPLDKPPSEPPTLHNVRTPPLAIVEVSVAPIKTVPWYKREIVGTIVDCVHLFRVCENGPGNAQTFHALRHKVCLGEEAHRLLRLGKITAPEGIWMTTWFAMDVGFWKKAWDEHEQWAIHADRRYAGEPFENIGYIFQSPNFENFEWL